MTEKDIIEDNNNVEGEGISNSFYLNTVCTYICSILIWNIFIDHYLLVSDTSLKNDRQNSRIDNTELPRTTLIIWDEAILTPVLTLCALKSYFTTAPERLIEQEFLMGDSKQVTLVSQQPQPQQPQQQQL
jgi:hypothetical protein